MQQDLCKWMESKKKRQRTKKLLANVRVYVGLCLFIYAMAPWVGPILSELDKCFKFILGDKDDYALYKITSRNVPNFRHLFSCDIIDICVDSYQFVAKTAE